MYLGNQRYSKGILIKDVTGCLLFWRTLQSPDMYKIMFTIYKLSGWGVSDASCSNQCHMELGANIYWGN